MYRLHQHRDRVHELMIISLSYTQRPRSTITILF